MGLTQRAIRKVSKRRAKDVPGAEGSPRTSVPAAAAVHIAADDPIVAHFLTATGAVDVDALDIKSPAVDELRAAGVRLVVPLVSQGELIGVLELGPRLSERDYSTDDRKLLDDLAGHAASAIRIAMLVTAQKAEVQSRERLAQELRVATLIQDQFLPKDLHEPRGWTFGTYYKPAREVGGDFYNFLPLPGGRVGIVVGDVTDKGVPAALVMAITHSILQSDAPRLISPSEVLARANELLVPQTPAHMFVTCLYAVLEPETGVLRFANAGHNLPYVRRSSGVEELRATGMPLGLMAGMIYEEKETVLAPGDVVMLASDGLAEAHGPGREMFGFPRTKELCRVTSGDRLIEALRTALDEFTGVGWEQEDDITIVTLERTADAGASAGAEESLTRFELASEPGNERQAMRMVADALAGHIEGQPLERLKTAVAEATMNAIEHGNANRADVPVEIEVRRTDASIAIEITDHGGEQAIPEAATPDLDAKLAGLQTPRGWGLFLIKNMVDEMHVSTSGERHTVRLVVRIGDRDGDE